MSKDYARIDRLYHVMVELMNAPKTKDVMLKMPSEVKNGQVFDFNGRTFGDTDKPDGLIFAKPDRVHNAQAITSALKRDYTKALKEWLDLDEEGAEDVETPKAKAKTKDTSDEDVAKKSKKKSKASKANDDAVEPPVEASEEFDLVSKVVDLLASGKLKKAKKLLGKHEDHADYKKSKKKYDKAVA